MKYVLCTTHGIGVKLWTYIWHKQTKRSRWQNMSIAYEALQLN